MARSIKSLGDRMLSRLAPQTTAKGGCPPDCVQNRQMSDGYCRYQTCCYTGACVWHCSSWSSWGSC